MSRLTRFTTTRLRNVLRSPWAIRPSILRGGLEMAPALPQLRATIDTGGQPLGVAAMYPAAADLAPALPQPRATIETGGQPCRHEHCPGVGLGRAAASSWLRG